MKKKLFLLSALPLFMGSLTGCGSSDGVKIGILTIDFPAVSIAAEGFLAELREAGIKAEGIKRIPSNASTRASYALDLVSQCDYLLGVGTDNSVALKGAIEEKGKAAEKTLFFTAVTDPADCGLVASWDNPTGFVCGSSDMNPVEDQIALIKECIPDVDKVGIFYTNDESNSRIQSDRAVAKLQALGIEYAIKTCTGATDIASSLTSFISENPTMDAIFIPTDNNIANHPGEVSSAVKNKGKLVVCGEANMLKGCGAVTLSVDYESLGRKCGKMAVQIIKGEKKANNFPVESSAASDCEYVMSLRNAAEAGVTIPKSVQDKCTNLDD